MILSVACLACVAEVLDFRSNHGKARGPASPARADSIVALSASRLIWPVMLPISSDDAAHGLRPPR